MKLIKFELVEAGDYSIYRAYVEVDIAPWWMVWKRIPKTEIYAGTDGRWFNKETGAQVRSKTLAIILNRAAMKQQLDEAFCNTRANLEEV